MVSAIYQRVEARDLQTVILETTDRDTLGLGARKIDTMTAFLERTSNETDCIPRTDRTVRLLRAD